jgi:hypothetical protein
MANLTLSIDDKLLQAARVRAVKEGTTVTEICRKAIEHFALADGRSRVERFDALISRLDANRSSDGGPLPSPWRSRQEMYEELLAPATKGTGKATRRR